MTRLVVMGLGYVGLPLAQEAVRSGLETVGYDVSATVVDSLNAGRSHVDDLSDDDVAAMLAGGFRATADPAVIGDADAVVICVPTPLGPGGGPNLDAVRAAGATVSERLRPGSLVVLESTTWPGTTEDVLAPILEESGLQAGVDFHLAFSPERIDPGNATYGFHNTPKVVGGLNDASADRAVALYSSMVQEVVRAKGCREAEMSKLLENTYRHINIALVNEMVKFCRELDIDLWDAIACASSKPFGFQAFYPGPGVGGHCIPIDPNYLSHHVRARLGYPFRFVELAQEVNNSMPRYVASRVAEMLNERGLPIRGSAVLLLGVTYKAGIADLRESPAVPLADVLLRQGARLAYYDPFVPHWSAAGGEFERVPDLAAALADADVVVHLQPHADYSDEVLAESETPVLDTRGVLTVPYAIRL